LIKELDQNWLIGALSGSKLIIQRRWGILFGDQVRGDLDAGSFGCIDSGRVNREPSETWEHLPDRGYCSRRGETNTLVSRLIDFIWFGLATLFSVQINH
jgi:hypothetical protein